MTPQILGYVLLASTVAGTVGGIIEAKVAPGTTMYRVGAFLASLGVDLASLAKLGQSAAPGAK